MVVRVQVEASGDICRTTIESSAPEIAAFEPCVRALFDGKKVPPASGGCVNVNIPLSFSIREDKDGGA